MQAPHKNCLEHDYFKKIEALATLSLYGQNVKIAIHHIIKDAYDFSRKNSDNSEAYLLALRDQLTTVARRTHPSMPGYKTAFEYAASLIVISKIDQRSYRMGVRR